MRERNLQLLKTLTETDGAPGHEGAVKTVIRQELQGVATLTEGSMGDLIAKARGSEGGPIILLAAHMDEVGFLVREITPDGFIRFAALGDWWAQVLLGQRVVIKTRQGDVPGVIGATAPHLLSAEQRQRTIPLGEMFIDVGAFTAQECRARLGVRLSDPILPVSPYTLLGNDDFVMAKALDDRIGCALIIECMHALGDVSHPNQVYGAFTVREEIGRANSSLSGWGVAPDICLVLEVGLPADTPATPPGQRSQDRVGGGVTLVIYDGVLLASAGLLDFFMAVADEQGIACQLATIGGNSAGHTAATSTVMYDVPSLCVAVPVRYAHSHNSLMCVRDYEQVLKLVLRVLQRLDEQALQAIRQS